MAPLYEFLADPSSFGAVWDADDHEAKVYWAMIEAESSFTMMQAYRPLLDAPNRDEESAWRVCSLLQGTGHWPEALDLCGYFASRFREDGRLPELAAALGNQAVIVSSRWSRHADLEKALYLHEQEERICRI